MGLVARALGLGLLGASVVFCAAPRRAPPAMPGAKASGPRDAGADASASADAGPSDAEAPEAEDPARYAAVAEAIRAAVEARKLPGCVLVVGSKDEIFLERAYGGRAVLPEPKAMTLDTVFDLASLTKPIATAMSVMILVERGKIALDAPASRYVPELSPLPPFTVRQLLTHTSGLPAETRLSDYATTDRALLMTRIGEATPKAQPGERFLYSDVGFIVLEEIVRRTSGQDLATFARENVFEPLGMKETGFLPGPDLRARAAPTSERDGGFIQGDVHDPVSFALGGVAGNAGLFSTARDMVRFARAMLGRGALGERRVLSEATFAAMTARVETPRGGRALGWDVDSVYATHKSPLLSPGAFGHGGYTGTAMWLDPERDRFVVFLSNRVHPDGTGAVNPLVKEVATLALRENQVETGIDVLEGEGFARLEGANVALVTNASARDAAGTTTIDAFREAKNLSLRAILSPEHGLAARSEGKIADAAYEGIPVYSLYGARMAPTDETLAGIDTIVVDLQDVGVRFYTYASTMARALRVAAERHLRFVVLDRPNPIDGVDVAGPVLRPASGSFVNHHALPVRHGMTMGELARMFAAVDHLAVRLEVVTMKRWRREDYFDQTGLSWTRPSPNLRTVDQAVLYPAIGLLEGTNLSVGRGTDTPFEVVGAPWIDGERLAARLRELAPAGVAFEPATFTPDASVYRGKTCEGVRVRVTDRAAFRPVRAGLTVARALHEQWPTEWDVDKVDRLLQSAPALEALEAGAGVSEIEATWRGELDAFKDARARFLLY